MAVRSEGQFLGEMAMFATAAVRCASVRAKGPVRVKIVPGEELMDLTPEVQFDGRHNVYSFLLLQADTLSRSCMLRTLRCTVSSGADHPLSLLTISCRLSLCRTCFVDPNRYSRCSAEFCCGALLAVGLNYCVLPTISFCWLMLSMCGVWLQARQQVQEMVWMKQSENMVLEAMTRLSTVHDALEELLMGAMMRPQTAETNTPL